MSEQPHPNHGHSPARWTGTVISAVGFLIGGLAFPFHIWAVVIAGGALQLVALITVGAMNAAGYGVPDVWGELKAEAKAGKQPVATLAPSAALQHSAAPAVAAAPESAPEAATEVVAESAPATASVTASQPATAAAATPADGASTGAGTDATPAEAEVEAEAQVKELSTQQS